MQRKRGWRKICLIVFENIEEGQPHHPERSMREDSRKLKSYSSMSFHKYFDQLESLIGVEQINLESWTNLVLLLVVVRKK